jgi:NADH dehydrogenase
MVRRLPPPLEPSTHLRAFGFLDAQIPRPPPLVLRIPSEVFPGVAPVAMQQGRYAAKVVQGRLRSRPTPQFRYRDKGNLATIGRAAAVADIKGLKLSGLIAWITWLVVHLWYLVGFQNRLLVFIRWTFSFATHGRGARLISESRPNASPGQPPMS